jgi:hypothetical protein
VLQPDLAAGAGGDGGGVGHEDEGVAALVEVAEDRHDHGLVDGVEVAGGLVGEDQRRLVDQGAGDGDALLLAARELARQVVEALAQPDAAQGLFGFTTVGHAVDVLGQHDVLQRGEIRDQVELLEDEADGALAVAGQLAGRHAGGTAEVHTADPHPARARTVEAGEDVEKRGLAGAGRAGDGHPLALVDGQVELVQGPERTEAAAEAFDLD